MRMLWVVAAVVGCAPPIDPTGLSCATETVGAELAAPSEEFGDLVDGSEVTCGYPPQGGGPYSPFRVRFQGPEVLAEGVVLELTATDAGDGALLGSAELAVGLVCANAGENQNYWYGGEVHLRYNGWALAELDGRDADLHLAALSLSADPVELESEVSVHLVAE